jgi:Carboxypeptidase regulatory-like domain
MVVEQGAAVPPGLLPPLFAGMEEELVRYAETDEAGRFALRVGPGTYTISGPNVPGQQEVQERPTIIAGKDVERDFTVPAEKRPWKTVRGIVRARAADGPPLAGARIVMAAIEGNSADAQGDSDDRGRFEVHGPTGKAIVYARNPEGSLAGVAVVEDKDDRELTIVAGPATTARGRVVDENGKPWASVRVIYVVNVGSGAISLRVLTDDDGRFSAPGVPAGIKCEFYAYYPGVQDQPYRRIEVKDAQPFEVPVLVMDRPIPLPPSPDTP